MGPLNLFFLWNLFFFSKDTLHNNIPVKGLGRKWVQQHPIFRDKSLKESLENLFKTTFKNLQDGLAAWKQIINRFLPPWNFG